MFTIHAYYLSLLTSMTKHNGVYADIIERFVLYIEKCVAVTKRS